MKGMFYYCNKIKTNFSGWDVSNVTNMQGTTHTACSHDVMFSEAYNFEGLGLDKWNTSSVTDMRDMFTKCEKLNVDLSHWNVSNVTQWEGAFKKCTNMLDHPELKPKFI